MKTARLSLASLSATVCILLFTLSVSAQTSGQVYTVNDISDSNDAILGDGQCADAAGKCTLRAAIQEANSDPSSRDTVIFALPNPSVIDLTLGELAITGQVAIVGPGARRLTLERSFNSGTPEFRIFHIAKEVQDLTIRGLTIRNGRTDGAAVWVAIGSTLSVADTYFYQNGKGDGGAIYNAGTISVSRSLFSSNGVGIGGAIYNVITSASGTIVNTTFTDNMATEGGAIYNNGSLLLINDTFFENIALSRCAAICSENSGPVRVLNTIFGQDTGSTHSLSGDFSSLGNNILVDPQMARGFVNGVNNDQVSDATGEVDPMLGKLANNGGQTDTAALLSESPAIDRGNTCITNGTCSISPPIRILTDQRRNFRGFLNPVDIGAYESGSSGLAGSFSFTLSGINRPARYVGSIAILTDAVTNEKRFAALNAIGLIRFQNLPNGTYVLELKAKRAGLAFDPLIIDGDDIPPFSFTDQDRGLRVTLEQEKPIDSRKITSSGIQSLSVLH